MLRLLIVVLLLAWPVKASTDAGARDPLTQSHERAFADAERMSPLVQNRFALYAAMARCDHADNHYAYEFVLRHFASSERFILEQAAAAGNAEGEARAARETGPCTVAVDQLRAADNDLMAKAELLPPQGFTSTLALELP